MYSRFIAVLAALGLVLTTAGAALGATQTSSTAQSLLVNTTLTLTGVPASVDYGNGLGGTTLSGPDNATNVQTSTNNPAGVKLALAFTDLSRTGGGGSITSTANQLTISAVTAAADCTGGATFGTNTMRPYPGPASAEWVICSRATAGTINFPGASKTWKYQVAVPAAQTPGTYTGTATWSAVEL